MDWPGRITILEDLMRRLSRALADMDARLRRAEQNIGQIARGGGGGGSPAIEPVYFVEVNTTVPGAVIVFPGAALNRQPSVFTGMVRRAIIPSPSSGDGLENMPGGPQTIRWWGCASLYTGEILPVVKAPDGTFDIVDRNVIAIGKVQNPDPSEPMEGGQMLEVINAKTYREFQAGTYSTSAPQATIPSVWALGPNNRTVANNAEVRVHMMMDYCVMDGIVNIT